MASFWNGRIQFSVFGEADGPAIGVTVDDLPPGEYVDTDALREFMSRRLIGDDLNISRGGEQPSILSGVRGSRTTGAPLMALIRNNEHIPDEGRNVPRLARPGNADYTGTMRYKGFNDVRHDGHLSRKLLAPLIFAGAVCGQILERRSIYTGAHIYSLHNIKDTPFDGINITRDDLVKIRKKPFPVINDKKGLRMQNDIETAANAGDSLGGVIEAAVVNLPAGIGSPMFDGVENVISRIIFGIPLVCGIEFGAGFTAAKMLGSQFNDEFYADDHGHLKTRTNNHGGVLGGITSGMPLVVRVALRPSPDMGRSVNAVDCSTLENIVTGENNSAVSCVVPSYVPAIEAAINIAVLSYMIDYPNF